MHAKFKNLPNYLTIVRICVIPIIVVTFYFDDTIFAHRLSAFLFSLAAITDFLDGYLARKYNLVTNLGKMLDPIADKLLIGAVLLMLVKFNKAGEIACILILMREFFIAGLREFLGEIKVSMPVSNLAKVKTFMQMLSIFILLLGTKGSTIPYFDKVGQLMLWFAALLTIITGYYYFKASLKYFK